MSNDHHFVSLNYFFQKNRNSLDVVFFASPLHCLQEELVVCLRKRNSGEQIGCNSPEKRNIVGKKFRKVNILDRAKELKCKIRPSTQVVAFAQRCKHFKCLKRHLLQTPALGVRIVKLFTQHVVRGDLWVPTNRSPPCWWWGYQSAICIHDWFEISCHFSPSLI